MGGEVRFSQIQFKAPIKVGAQIVSGVFGSLPQSGEDRAWLSPSHARAYCEDWPDKDRADIGEYYLPTVPRGNEEGVTTILTPSSLRPVSFFEQDDLWTIDFGAKGSSWAALMLLKSIATAKDSPDGACVHLMNIAVVTTVYSQV